MVQMARSKKPAWVMGWASEEAHLDAWYDFSHGGCWVARLFTALDWAIPSLLRTAADAHRDRSYRFGTQSRDIEDSIGFRVIGRQQSSDSGEITRYDHEGKPDDCWLVYFDGNVIKTEVGHTLASARKRFAELFATNCPGLKYGDAIVVRPEWAYASLAADDPDRTSYEARIREIDERIAANRAAYRAREAADTEEREKDELLVLLERYGHPDTWEK